MNATNFSINNQNVNGQLKAYYNTASFSSTAQLKLAGVTLNSKVWEQFTFVEQSPKIEILWNYKKSESELHTLKIAADKISLPGVFLENLTVDISQMVNAANRQNNLQVLIKPAKLVTDSSFFENEIIGEVLNKKNGFKLDSLTSSRTSLVLTGTDWKNISFNLDSHFLSEPNPKSDTYLTLKGSARYEEGLDARLVLQSRGQSLKFDMTRDESDKIVIKQLL